jgi:ABC-2 type transport system permease protein
VSARFPSTVGVVGTQVRYQLLTFRRTSVAMFFTLVLPLIMLVLFNALFDGEVATPRGTWPVRQFYTGGLAAFTAVSATFTNLANTIPINRDDGILKRWRGTPLPPALYLAGSVLSAVVIALVGVLIMLTIGVAAYGLEIEVAKLPAALLTFVVGVSAFAALGLAIAGLVPSASSASAIANATILPLAFISDTFIAIDEPPAWMRTVGNFFPLKPFVNSFQDAFNPLVDAPAIRWTSLGWLVLWGAFGAAVALRFFRWEPAMGGGRQRRTRRAQPNVAPAD